MAASQILPKSYCVDLIGNCSNSFGDSKIPTNVQVLKVLFYNLRILKLTVRESASLVVKDVLKLWEKADIPTKTMSNSITKLENLYNEWRNLRKNNRNTECQKMKVKMWQEKLDELFDVAHANALQKHRDFLIILRRNGSKTPDPLCGINTEKVAVKRPHPVEKRKPNSFKRFERNKAEIDIIDVTAEILLPESTVSDHSFSCMASDQLFSGTTAKKFKGTKNILTPKLAAVLDVCKINDTNAVRIINAVVESLGHNVEDYGLNLTNLHHARQQIRDETVSNKRKKN